MTPEDIRALCASAFAGEAEVIERPKCWPRCSISNYVQGGRWCRVCSPEPRVLALARFAQAVLDALDEQYYVGTQDVDERPSDVISRIRDAAKRNMEKP